MADSVKTQDKEELTQLVSWYEQALEATQAERREAERDDDYYNLNQYTPEQLETFKARKQQPSVSAIIQKNVNFLLGVERQNRSDPKAYPRTPAHEDAAHAASDSIRYVLENNQFDYKASASYKDLLVQGLCGAVIEVEATGIDDYEIKVTRVAWDRCFRDPHSREEDFSDARYKGYIKWMDIEDAQELGKKYGYTGEFSTEESEFGSSDNDKPSYQIWYDSRRKRVKVTWIWFLKKGEWYHAVFSKAGIIWGPELCAYKDEDGNPECNFIMQSSLVDRENNRYGYVRSFISPTDSINKRESKALHLFSQRQTWSKKGAFTNKNEAKRELGKPDGHLEVNEGSEIGRDFGILETGDMALGQFQLLQQAKADLDKLASTADSSASSSASGRALDARAELGQSELTPFTDAHRHWKIRIYRCVWNKIRQFWTPEKWVRITDDEENLKWVGLNVPVTQAEQIVMQKTGEPIDVVRKKYAQHISQAVQLRPDLAQVAEVQNEVAELDVDIIIDEMPNVINFQQEQFASIARYAEKFGGIPPKLLIKMMPGLRNKEQIIDEMQGDEKQQAAAAQAQQMAQQVQLRNENAEAEKKEADAKKAQQEAVQTALENEIMLRQPIDTKIII